MVLVLKSAEVETNNLMLSIDAMVTLSIVIADSAIASANGESVVIVPVESPFFVPNLT